METVEPVLQEPWTEGILGCSTKGLDDEEEAVLRRLGSKGPREEKRTLYTNAAYKNGEGGIAVVQGKSGKTITQRRLPGWAVGDSTVAELIAIEAALSYQARRRPLPSATIIATDSKRAIRYIVKGTSPHDSMWYDTSVSTSRLSGTRREVRCFYSGYPPIEA